MAKGEFFFSWTWKFRDFKNLPIQANWVRYPIKESVWCLQQYYSLWVSQGEFPYCLGSQCPFANLSLRIFMRYLCFWCFKMANQGLWHLMNLYWNLQHLCIFMIKKAMFLEVALKDTLLFHLIILNFTILQVFSLIYLTV